MMQIVFHRRFVKRYKKLRSGERKKFKERKNLFLVNPFHPILENHPLSGKHEGYRSINIAGDLRAVYKHLDKNIVVFAEIGTHSELYST
ncbi:MAG: type II toxin-antitoxin system mRNA interferase toxin, RelE/StbE family [Patescibacteria group bacterium]